MTTSLLPPNATQGCEGLPRRAFTIAEVERMLDIGVLDRDERFELIGGEIALMSPQRRRHAILRSRLAAWLSARCPPGLEVHQELTVALGAQLFEPDVAITSPQPLDGQYTPIAEVRLAIEIADTSLVRDRDIKAPEYAKAGLAELWIVDLNALETLRLRAPGDGGYQEATPMPFAAALSPLCTPELTVTLAELAA